MSEFVVSIDADEEREADKTLRTSLEPPDGPGPSGGGRLGCLKIALPVLLVLSLALLAFGYLYWQSVKRSPAYSLAMLVEASRAGDEKAMDELVDTDAVVDAFLPQVIEKAVELYGRGVPTFAIERLSTLTEQFKPAIKRRAKEEVPRVIREKTDRFQSVPGWAIALGAGWFLDIAETGDTATVKSLIPERPFELTMKRNGDVWRITSIKDEALARRIAEKVGQEMIRIVQSEGLKKAGEKLGVGNLEDLKKKIEDLMP